MTGADPLSNDPDFALHQLFAQADPPQARPGDTLFVAAVMQQIEAEAARRRARTRSAVTGIAAAAGITGGALLPLAVTPIQTALAGLAATAPPVGAAAASGSGPAFILALCLIGLGAGALLQRQG
jgi:hypothetical protein